jgi:hypothetical protein
VPQAPQIQVVPQQQYVAPQQPAFPGQVVPAQVGAALQAGTVDAVQAIPQPSSPALQAVNALAAQAPQAQQAPSLVSEADVATVKSLIAAGLAPDVAVSQYGTVSGKNSPEFLQALTVATAGQ